MDNFTPIEVLNQLILMIGSKYPNAKREITSLLYSLSYIAPEIIDNKFWGWDGPSQGFPGLCRYHFSDEDKFTIHIKNFYDAVVKKYKEDKWSGKMDYDKFVVAN
tara:strand:+ start:28 stop:342 length:315 start_codon:yes stop_codon:yes gene_type:complete